MQIDNLRKRLNEDKCTKTLTEVFCNQNQAMEKYTGLKQDDTLKMLHVVCQWIKMISEKIERHNHHRLCGHDGKGNITIDKIFC